MNIFINNVKHDLGQPQNLAEVLVVNNIIQQKGIAVAVNNNVVPRTEWKNYTIKENDKITIITATQGG